MLNLSQLNEKEPVASLLSLDEVKKHCYETGTSNDDLLRFLIKVAREVAEAKTWRQIIPATYILYLDEFPEDIIELPKPPCIGVTNIKYYVNDVLTTLDSSLYEVDATSEPARIKPDAFWPSADEKLNAVQITFTSGYDASDEFHTLPEKIRQAMKFIVKHFYDNRDMVLFSEGRSLDVSEIPKTADYLLEMESFRTFV